MRSDQFLIGVSLPQISESPSNGGLRKGYRDGFGGLGRLFTAKKATRSATFYKYLSRTVYLSALSRFYRNSGIFSSAQVFLQRDAEPRGQSLCVAVAAEQQKSTIRRRIVWHSTKKFGR